MSILDILINDIIIYIVPFLKTYDKLMFLSSSKDLHHLKDKVTYDYMVNIRRIQRLWYYGKFTNIYTNDIGNFKFPISINRLTFSNNFNKDIKGMIPDTITHLTFGDNFDQNIEECIPNS